MSDTKVTGGLVQRWVSVTDTRGRTRLEARWTTAPQGDAPADDTHATTTPHAA